MGKPLLCVVSQHWEKSKGSWAGTGYSASWEISIRGNYFKGRCPLVSFFRFLPNKCFHLVTILHFEQEGKTFSEFDAKVNSFSINALLFSTATGFAVCEEPKRCRDTAH